MAKFGDTVTNVLSRAWQSKQTWCFSTKVGTDDSFPDEYTKAIKSFNPDVKFSSIRFITAATLEFFHNSIVEAHEKKRRRFVHVAASKNEVAAGDTLSLSRRYRQTPFARAWVQE